MDYIFRILVQSSRCHHVVRVRYSPSLATFPSSRRRYQRTFVDIFTARIKRLPVSTRPCTLLLTIYYYVCLYTCIAFVMRNWFNAFVPLIEIVADIAMCNNQKQFPLILQHDRDTTTFSAKQGVICYALQSNTAFTLGATCSLVSNIANYLIALRNPRDSLARWTALRDQIRETIANNCLISLEIACADLSLSELRYSETVEHHCRDRE